MSGRGLRRFGRAGVILLILASAVGSPATSAAEDPTLFGRWSEPFWEGGALPYDPPSLEKSAKFPTAVNAVVLPDGRLLYWNGVEGSEKATVLFLDQDLNFIMENSRARILDIGAPEPKWTVPTYERGTTNEAQDQPHSATHDLFCVDQKLLHDGTVLLAGGTEWRNQEHEAFGDDETRIFEPSIDTFRSVEPMREPRFYPSLVTLPDGRVLATSGTRRVVFSFLNPEPAFSQVRLSEIYDPSTEKWEDAGMDRLSLPLYPRLHLLPDGTIFYPGVGEFWAPFGETGDQGVWGFRRVYDPASESWTMMDHSRYGARNGASSTLLRLEPPYNHADMLIAGGTVGVAPGTWVATTLSEVVRWTPEGFENVGEPKSPFAGLTGDRTQVRHRRWLGTTVMLPTGEVFLANGGDMDDLIDPGSAAAVRTAELYDPKTGTWRELGTAARDRVYHSTAVLLPDGRILVGGNAPPPAHYFRHDHPVTRNNNFKDATFEIYEPPYLFRGDRPVVSKIAPIRRGRALTLTLGDQTSPREIAEVVLVRMSTNTHGIDADMRAVKLQQRATRGAVMARLPKGGDGRILPPGPYYVFAMRNTAEGPVPSIAKVVLIQPAGEGHRVVARTP
ncbi:MAG TPA: galactose oxidase-like domain-containing protein [Actinomycetota bacterium]|nr:galactose oxidase-like domain-containing protein [Actinomycetota bacterium]